MLINLIVSCAIFATRILDIRAIVCVCVRARRNVETSKLLHVLLCITQMAEKSRVYTVLLKIVRGEYFTA